MIQEIGFITPESGWPSSDSSWQRYYMLGTTTKLPVPFQVLGLYIVTLKRKILHCLKKKSTKTRLKNIKNVKGCRDGMPKSMQTR